MKRLLIYLSVIGVCLTALPIQAEAGSRDRKNDRSWGRHHGYYTREYYRRHQPPIIGDIVPTTGTTTIRTGITATPVALASALVFDATEPEV